MSSPAPKSHVLSGILYPWVFRITMAVFALAFIIGLIGMLREPDGLGTAPENIWRDLWPLMKQGRHEEALELARSVSVMMPNPMAHEIIGTLCLELEDYECAEENLRLAMELDPVHVEPIGKLALTLLKSGRRDEGERWMNLALERAPESKALKRDYASFLELSGQTEEALSAYEDFLRENPEDADARTSRATLLMDLGRLQESEKEFRQVLEIDPDYFDALNNLGALVAGQSRFDEALTLFERVHALNPRDENAHFNYAQALVDLGRTEQAHQEFSKLREKSKDPVLIGEIDRTLEKLPRQS